MKQRWDEDLDGDGYKGVYTHTTDPDTGEIISEQGDAFPSDPTQWFDRDGDGYGDNAEGNNADACPDETGTSYIDYLGCFDDGDGWRDANEPLLQNNPTQWKDTDLDGFGDNWETKLGRLVVIPHGPVNLLKAPPTLIFVRSPKWDGALTAKDATFLNSTATTTG